LHRLLEQVVDPVHVPLFFAILRQGARPPSRRPPMDKSTRTCFLCSDGSMSIWMILARSAQIFPGPPETRSEKRAPHCDEKVALGGGAVGDGGAVHADHPQVPG
jgi:hypothetical protein